MRLHDIAIVGRLHSENLFAIARPLFAVENAPGLCGTLEAHSTTGRDELVA
jgi:hypothetical protein